VKHLFVINPISGGKRHKYEKTKEQIIAAMSKNGGDYEIYITQKPHDATEKVRREAETGEELRVYACGGDGTFHECANGCVGYNNASVTFFPCGTGNDFIKTFGDEKELFFDIEKLINGFVHPIDVIRCNDRYSINICSLGFDARIAGDVHKYNRIPLVKGMLAYIFSLIAHFFKGINQHFTITTGDKTQSGEYALICTCNGKYYGGGFNPINDNMPDDGIMDTLIVKRCSRFNVIKLSGQYATGRYREAGEIVKRYSDSRIIIEADDEMAINLDGEIFRNRKAEMSMVHNGVNLLCPNGMKFFDNASENERKQEKTEAFA